MKQRSWYIPVWHSLPGVVAAWQSIRAPDHLHARWNVCAHMARVGQYNATPYTTASALTFAPRTGWKSDGTQFLMTGLVPADGWAAICRFSGGSYSATGRTVVGSQTSATTAFFIRPTRGSAGDDRVYAQGGAIVTGVRIYTGIMGVSGQYGYLNGVSEAGPIDAWSGTATFDIYIGANNDGGAHAIWNGYIECAAVYNRTLSANEMWLASKQMQYCELNPDWNAWVPPRQWFLPARIPVPRQQITMLGVSRVIVE